MCSKSCFGVGRVRLNCDLPEALLGGITVDGLHLCMSLSSFFAVAGCPNFSPRISAGDIINVNVSGNNCPASEGMMVNFGLRFWNLRNSYGWRACSVCGGVEGL